MLAANSAAVTVSAAEIGEEVTNEEIITEEFITEAEAEVMDLDGMETDIGDDMNSTVRSAGDVNKDGSIDSLDATKILINYAKYLNNGGKKPSTGDTNGDGIADSRDATAILVYYAEQLLKEAGSSYPKTITNNNESMLRVGVAKQGKLTNIYKLNIDSDSQTEVILKYTQSGYKPFYMIYDNGKAIKNYNFPLNEPQDTLFGDIGDMVNMTFAVIKRNNKYRAVYEYDRLVAGYGYASWTEVIPGKMPKDCTTFAGADFSIPYNNKHTGRFTGGFYYDSKNVSFDTFKKNISAIEIYTSASGTKSYWIELINSIKRYYM
jgi:hypothetical protein